MYELHPPDQMLQVAQPPERRALPGQSQVIVLMMMIVLIIIIVVMIIMVVFEV